MSRLFAALALVLFLSPRPAAAGDLTLRDVIELQRSGLGDELLVAVIEADGGPFQLSMADILDLRSYGMSERVISALLRTGTRRTGSSDAPAVNVQQHVTQVAPTVVIVNDHDDRPAHVPPPYGSRRGSGFTPGPGQIPPMVTPPATWTTRQEDGRNVGSGGEVKTHKPAAMWVTPRDGSTKRSDGEKRPKG
jgi:hypothetical protein